MEKHITLVGVFHIGFGILGVLGAVIIWVLVVGGSLLTGDQEVIGIVSFIATVIAFFLFFMSIPGIIGGVGLLKRQSWARILVLIISVLYLIRIPYGTAIGIYSIWVLINEETKRLFSSEHAS